MVEISQYNRGQNASYRPPASVQTRGSVSDFEKMNRNLIKYIFYGLALLFLFHFETLSIGPIKISHLWKGIALLYLLFDIIKRKQKVFIYKPLIWIAIMQLINIELTTNPFNAFVIFSTTLILPVIGIYVLKFNHSQLKKAIIFFASFFILSFVPYQLGLIKSLEEGYNLSAYGGTTGLIGPFQNPHGAAISLASALLVVLFYWFKGSINKLYLTTLFLLGSYFLLSTYVRTGLAMFTIGSIPTLLYFAKNRARRFSQLAIFAFFMAMLVSNWVVNNEILMNRITGRSKYGSEKTLENIGSNRGRIYIASLEIFAEANIIEKIFGLGETEQINRIEDKINMAIGSHNGFLDILLRNGLIGFFLLIIYFIRIHKLRKIVHQEEKILIKSLYWALLTMTFVQGFNWINFNIILMLTISLSIKPIKAVQNNN